MRCNREQLRPSTPYKRSIVGLRCPQHRAVNSHGAGRFGAACRKSRAWETGGVAEKALHCRPLRDGRPLRRPHTIPISISLTGVRS